MTKLIKTSLFLFLFLFSSQVHAETIQLWTAGHTLAAIGTAAATNYFMNVMSSSGQNTTEANRRSVAPSAGTVLRMKATLTTAPDNGANSQTVTFAMRINGSTTSTTCTITETETSCESNTTSTYTAGQALAVIQTAANTPAASNFYVWIWAVDDTNNKTIYSGSTESSLMSASATGYGSFAASNGGGSTTENVVQAPMPFAGTVVALYVLLDGSPDLGAGTQSYTFKIYIGGAGSTSTCAISETATTCNDTTNQPTFTAGQTLSWEVIPAGTPTARRVAISIAVTNTVGGFAFIGGINGATSLGASTLYHPIHGPFSWNATETNRQQGISQVQLWALYVDMFTAPDNGAGTQTYTWTVRDDVAATNCSCVVSEAETTCNDTCTDDVIVDSKMTLENVPASTPTASGGFAGVWAFINPRDFFMVN